MAKIVEVWRVEHVNCPKAKQDTTKPAHVNHGPQAWIDYACGRTARPDFGSVGNPPRHITPNTYCGVTRRQMGNWWGSTRAEFLEKKKLWRDAGWAFVIYKMPKSRVRWDNGQVIFDPVNAQNRRVLTWDEVPLPHS